MAISTIDNNGANLGQLGNRNLIINGSMAISQRLGSTVYAQINDGYSLDRFKGNSYDGGLTTGKYTVQQSTTSPDGFSFSMLITSTASTSDNANNIFDIEQKIEGFNTAHLGFGTSSAKTVTLSFWVRSSLTGTFGGAVKNEARDRAYPFSYTISSANTFEHKTIVIEGDTSGTWVGATSGTGLWLSFGLGVGSTRSGTAGAWGGGDMFSSTGATSLVGTSGATLYLTGVQLEVGDTATPFEHKNVGQELSDCQRYYWAQPSGYQDGSTGKKASVGSILAFNSTGIFPVTMRVNPTATASTGSINYENCSGLSVTRNQNGYQSRVSSSGGNYRAWDWSATFDAEL
jgi:hypothetical protein